MAQAAKGQEPSMEEILASIRRIIADDDGAKVPPPKAVEPLTPVPPPRMTPPPPQPPVQPMSAPSGTVTEQDEIEAMLARLDPVSASQMPEPEDEPSADIFELTEQMTAASLPEPHGFSAVEGRSEVMVDETPRAPEPPPAREPDRSPAAERSDRTLISPSTSAAVDSAFNTLAQTVLVQNGRTLEDLVREMLRPMLKSWLDDNLPGMVERLVRAEIERVSRGRS
jgi:uncharacterized protein